MGTNNFHKTNATKYYAVLMDYEQPVLDDDGNETSETETVSCQDFDYENELDYINDMVQELCKAKTYLYNENGFCSSELRSYPVKELGVVSNYKRFGDMEVAVRISLLLRNGYYEGSNLDYELQYEFVDNGNEYDEPDFTDDFQYHSRMSKGLATIQAKNAEKWAKKAMETLINDIEAMYEKISMPLNCVARFSNGEAIYEKA